MPKTSYSPINYTISTSKDALSWAASSCPFKACDKKAELKLKSYLVCLAAELGWPPTSVLQAESWRGTWRDKIFDFFIQRDFLWLYSSISKAEFSFGGRLWLPMFTFSLSQPCWWPLCSPRSQGTTAQSQAQATRLPLGEDMLVSPLTCPGKPELFLCLSNTPGSVKPQLTEVLEIASLRKVSPCQEHKTQPHRSFPSLISTGLCQQNSEGKYFLKQGGGGGKALLVFCHVFPINTGVRWV